MDYQKLKNCELFLFDMDGTLYLGDNVYAGAIELMNDLPALGKKYIYLTNNSSRAGTDYITRLRRLGFPCESENVFTSGMATGMYLNQRHPGASVYLALSTTTPGTPRRTPSTWWCRALTRSLCMKSLNARATSCGAARRSSRQTQTGSAPCPRMRSCPTAAASVRF